MLVEVEEKPELVVEIKVEVRIEVEVEVSKLGSVLWISQNYADKYFIYKFCSCFFD